jgi:hypothetical protein
VIAGVSVKNIQTKLKGAGLHEAVNQNIRLLASIFPQAHFHDKQSAYVNDFILAGFPWSFLQETASMKTLT